MKLVTVKRKIFFNKFLMCAISHNKLIVDVKYLVICIIKEPMFNELLLLVKEVTFATNYLN